MAQEFLMKDPKRRRHIILITFFFILVLCLGTQYVTLRQSRNESYYIIPTESKLQTENSQNDSLLGVLSEQIANISVTLTETTNYEQIYTVKYPDSTSKYHKRQVFVDMKDIKQTTENIFFIESRCATETLAKNYRGKKDFVLNVRQCCAIESTALTNLDREVYIFHSCPLSDNFIIHSPTYVKLLFSYPNVHVVRLNNAEVFSGSPVQELYEKKLLETSSYPIEHSSDVLRLTLLWKFGGTYCDLDVVTIRSLSELKANWAGMQDEETIANGVVNFEPSGVGHSMLQQALEHVNKHFDGSSWGTNGPQLITPLILQRCKAVSVKEASRRCEVNFTVYDSCVLYPLYYTQSNDFFNEDIGVQIVQKVKPSAYSVHIWNKMSHEMEGIVGSTQAYALLAEEFCPTVYENCGSSF